MDFNNIDIGDDREFVKRLSKQNGVKDGKKLKTSNSGKIKDNGLAMTTYSISDILQGVHAYKPAGLTANAFNQLMTSQLQKIGQLTDEGKTDGDIAVRLGSRSEFLPADLMNKSFFQQASVGASYNQEGQTQAAGPIDTTGANEINLKYTDIAGVTNIRSDAGPNGSTIQLGTYMGTEVNMAVIASWKALVDAAAAQGYQIKGSGYRSNTRQIELRRAHCGTSNFAIYEMSPSACHPPTARPGSSKHEVGLAVDVSPCDRGSPNFNWLQKNAGTYGWYNLPSESWHWSTSGS